MSRIGERFDVLRAEGRTALIPFVTAGDPQPAVTVPMMHAMVEAGADLIELGVPFSDPMADGPAIQLADERALAHHVSLRQVLEMVGRFREQDGVTPVVLMGYLNPIEVMGYAAFAQAASAAGVDGVITVDMPPEEAGEILPLFRAAAVDPIFLLAPTSNRQRIETVCASASGFVYYVSIKGVTGTRQPDSGEVRQRLEQIRAVTDLPVGVGFGIRDAASAARFAEFADAVIVGSALVNRIAEFADRPSELLSSVAALLREMRQAMDKDTG